MNDKHKYEVNLQSTGERKGMLSSPVLPSQIEVVTPPDFPKGIAGFWSPEHLFVASVSSCLMTTFFAVADHSKLEYLRFKCKAVGIVKKVEHKYVVAEIMLKPNLVIPASEQLDRAKRIIEMSEKACLIANSIQSKITVESTIDIK